MILQNSDNTPKSCNSQSGADSSLTYEQLRALHTSEFQASAIHPDLWDNFVTYDNNEDILNELFIGNLPRTNTGRVASYYLNTYGHIKSGWGVGTVGSDYIQFKPDAAYRRCDSDGKEIKYENPPKFPTDIIRFKKTPEWLALNLGTDSKPFWDWANSPNCKHGYITEGAKKAASLLSKRLVTIGLVGINNLCNTSEESQKTPIPALVDFVRNKEEITIAFDAPERLSQIQPLISAYDKLKQLIYNINPECKVTIACWDWHLGKGIDDVIAAGHWDKVRIKPYYEALRFINSNIPASKRITDKEYLSLEDVENFAHKYVAIKAPKNSGKTEIVSRFLKTLEDTIKVLSITHRIKLGKQQADRFWLYYITDSTGKNTGDKFLKGYKLALCINSLHTQKGINPDDWKDAVIILDEVVQLLNHITNSGTLKKAPEILNNFREILRNAKKVIVMDADLDFKTLKALDEIIGTDCDFLKQVHVYEFEKKADKIPLELHYASSKNVGTRTYEEILRQLLEGKKVLGFVDSQGFASKLGAENLVKAIKKAYNSSNAHQEAIQHTENLVKAIKKAYKQETGKELKAMAVYAKATKNKGHDASKIAENIESFYDYDLVIYTSVIGTGVSLEKSHFDIVVGGFVGALSIDEILQGLYRYRPSVPRIVFLPKMGMQFKKDGSDYSAKANKFKVSKIKSEILTVYSALADEIPESDAINEPIRNYHAKLRALGKLESDNYWEFFIEKAQEDYDVTVFDNKVQAQTPVILEEAIEETLTEEWQKTDRGNLLPNEEYEKAKAEESLPEPKYYDYEKTKLAKKYDLEEHPEVLNEELYLIDTKRKNYLSEVRTHYLLDREEEVKFRDELVLKSNQFDHEKYKKVQLTKINLLKALGVEKLLETAGKVLHRCHPVVEEIISNYQNIEQTSQGVIDRYLNIRLNLQKPRPMEFIESLAQKLGMKSKPLGKITLPSGERINQVVFKIPDTIRYKIFQAWDENFAKEKALREAKEQREKLTHEQLTELTQKDTKTLQLLLDWENAQKEDSKYPEWMSDESIADVVAMIESCQNVTMVEELQKIIPSFAIKAAQNLELFNSFKQNLILLNTGAIQKTNGSWEEGIREFKRARKLDLF
ncbi:DUF3854 domain-containing protein [Tolypothrix campylonemoides VB511288]|nr:DUF3854 domain-containing protein [Tolypothrix campylonemoides VB511288]